jgi:ribosomal protein L37AE/L43A
MKKWKPNISQLKNNLMNKPKSSEGKGIKEKLCPKCNKIMRPWFDRQEFVGWNCGDCFNTFIKKDEPKITR